MRLRSRGARQGKRHMGSQEWNVAVDEAPSPARGKVWLQRFAGIVLGGLAGTAAAFSADLWHVVATGSVETSGERAVAERPGAGRDDHTAPIPAPDGAESARQFAHTLITRAR